MSPQKRRTLGDRNRAAIAGEPDPASPVETTTQPIEPVATAPTRAPKPDTKTPTAKTSTPRKSATKTATPAKAEKQGAGQVTRLGIYVTPQEFTDAKAAYLAAWQLGGEADTFAKWIGAAIDAHASRSVTERTELARPQERSAQRSGSTRSFSVASDVVARMRKAITADQQAGRFPSDSAWCGDAIAAAVQSTRQAAGGDLPTPPARLPNRLVR
ncbi:hypothetical protein EEW87_17625 (plasmid) [Janibacter melonis]|uniref:Uncharacterized protein n=1 Tax=Janibacter melonis TaxID=262209 RepID=A0A650GFR2_9MICO|nr:hypothetical protein [Janibacter melonis]QGX08825.1 hypothetical protein EEW87_17625 [Janibacter melonis]